jgi:hypothetical protein
VIISEEAINLNQFLLQYRLGVKKRVGRFLLYFLVHPIPLSSLDFW